jgi:AraC-like DNA-binding protein
MGTRAHPDFRSGPGSARSLSETPRRLTESRSLSNTAVDARGPMFWRDPALPFIEARSVQDGRQVSYGRHSHETFSIGLISRGRCNYINRTKTKEASAGTVVLMNPGDVHACNPVSGQPWSYRMLYIDVDWLSETRGHCFAPFAALSILQPELYDGLNRLFDTLIDPQIEHLEKESASVSFMERVHRFLGTNPSLHSAPVPSLVRAADFIRHNCTRSLKLADICAAAGLSASHLIRAFRQSYGLTPHAYQLNCRVEHCRSQLRAGHPIAEVAFEAGFADQAHFQRTFKRFFAATPGQYQSRRF